MFFEYERTRVNKETVNLWYLLAIFVNDLIAMFGYSTCVFVISTALSMLKSLLDDKALCGGVGMNWKAARTHLIVVLVFWIT